MGNLNPGIPPLPPVPPGGFARNGGHRQAHSNWWELGLEEQRAEMGGILGVHCGRGHV